MKRIRQQYGQTLRVILLRRLFTFKINAGYVRFAQALLNQLGLVRVYYAVDNRKNNHLKNSK